MGLLLPLLPPVSRANGTEGQQSAQSGTETPEKVPKTVRQAFRVGTEKHSASAGNRKSGDDTGKCLDGQRLRRGRDGCDTEQLTALFGWNTLKRSELYVQKPPIRAESAVGDEGTEVQC